MANTRKIALHYLQHPSWSALPADDRELLELAVKAARNAHAPYSKFKGGAVSYTHLTLPTSDLV